jgi:acyl-CoA dehydrogenase
MRSSPNGRRPSPDCMPDTSAIRAFLTNRHLTVAENVAAFAREVVAGYPEPADDDAGRVQARKLAGVIGEAGWYAPIEELDLRGVSLVREALAWASPLADAVYALQALGTVPILLAGDDAQKDRWAGPALRGEQIAAFAMTEPEAGSDVAAMATTATKDGDDYVLQGTKTLISNAGIADFYTVFASTDPASGSRGVSCFVVPAVSDGFEFVEPLVLSAPHPLGTIAFNGCRVPACHRLGHENEGFKLGLRTLDLLRGTVAAAACGMAARALDASLEYADSRHQFGKPLADFQLIQQKLARMATELTAARLLVYRSAWEKDGGAERVTLEAAMAKAFATEAAQRIVDDAVQIHGGQGVLRASVVDRLYRSVRALRIYEGTTEMQHLVIAGLLLKAYRSAR